MNRRRDAAHALIALASSNDYQDRADAGRGLAAFADLAVSHDALVALVLDPHNTFVTLQTARALLQTKDPRAFEILATAIAVSVDGTLDYIADAVRGVLGIYATELSTAKQIYARLEEHPDDRTRTGAKIVSSILGPMQPVLTAVGDFRIGQIYEDCSFHPVLCTHLSIDDDEMLGISLIDGSGPRACSPRFCGPLPLTVNQVVHIKSNFANYAAGRAAGREPQEIIRAISTP